jgi:hypothetical protein
MGGVKYKKVQIKRAEKALRCVMDWLFLRNYDKYGKNLLAIIEKAMTFGFLTKNRKKNWKITPRF